MSRFVSTEVLKENIMAELRELFSGDFSGHDILHTSRVLKNALEISRKEGGDVYIIMLSSLLHDADDKKLFPETANEHLNAKRILKKHKVTDEDSERIIEIIRSVSFSSGIKASSLEAEIVQDADRLDALGAIGIARCFSYGASHGRAIYNEDDFVGNNIEQSDSGISHFYQKLLKLEKLMNTEAAGKEANVRTAFLRDYLSHFREEIMSEF